MLPLIRTEVVDKRKWITSEAFLDGVAVSQSIPGALAVNSATFVGNRVAGTVGAIVAAFGAVLPSYIILILVSAFFLSFRELAPVQNFFKGAVPAVAAGLLEGLEEPGSASVEHGGAGSFTLAIDNFKGLLC